MRKYVTNVQRNCIIFFKECFNVSACSSYLEVDHSLFYSYHKMFLPFLSLNLSLVPVKTIFLDPYLNFIFVFFFCYWISVKNWYSPINLSQPLPIFDSQWMLTHKIYNVLTRTIQFHWQFLITNSGFWLINILLRKFNTSSKKEMKMIKAQLFWWKRMKRCQKSLCKHRVTFFTLNSPPLIHDVTCPKL